jgi:hypothetical protein
LIEEEELFGAPSTSVTDFFTAGQMRGAQRNKPAAQLFTTSAHRQSSET